MTRMERDAFGEIEVPADHLWGAQTQRSLEHFHISTERMPMALMLALAEVKRACATVNRDLGLLAADKAQAIITAAEEVLDGKHTQEFPLSVWQTGSGTQSNMNMNEVLANRASELMGGDAGMDRLLHPNDEVNLGQSSNDIFPTAMHVSAVAGISGQVLPALIALRTSLSAKSEAFSDMIKIGRTHLQDATPLTLGQEFSGYVAQLVQAEAALKATLEPLYQLAVGGTAVGTGLNTPPEFGSRVAKELSLRTSFSFKSADNKFAALATHDALVNAHGALKLLAVSLNKIANDIRWMASGPRSGLGELHLPENEPGSSIMPGKVNPTQCEALTMLCYQVMANDLAITLGGASGNFELNVYKPLIAHAFSQSLRLLADGMTSFDRHCVQGIEAVPQRLTELMERSLMLVTALVPHIGYDRAAEIAKHAQAQGVTLKQAAVALEYVTAEDYDSWVVYSAMTHPSGQSSS